VAPNAIELHPVLAFRCLTAPVTIPTPPTKCAPSYPDVCIPPSPPDLDCADIRYRNFRVLWNVPDPDPHHFDGNRDGTGCQS
jgi:micrococcal nuclease